MGDFGHINRKIHKPLCNFAHSKLLNMISRFMGAALIDHTE